ncbi:DNA-binding transcriptional LysR family regulator [Shinella sp. BE166]|uniref:LysR substrate-binding domain-containing protein n=1 Tax=Shinella sp. BE166 TaxID=3373918 RepID=UPI003EBA5CF9
MKFHQISAFEAVTRAGGIRAAARTLGLTQSAITKAIRELEAEAGVSLLLRSARGVVLTESGRQLAARAHLLVEQMRAAQDDIRQLNAGTGGKLVVGLTPTIIETVLSEIIRHFRTRMPGVRLVIHEASLPGSLPDIRDGTFDLAVVGAGREPATASDLACEFLLSVNKRIALRRGHPLAGIRDPAELADAVWVLPQEPSDPSDPMHAFMQEAGLAMPPKLVECVSLPATVSIIANSDMVSALPEPLIDQPHVASRIVSLAFEQKLQPSRYWLLRRSAVPLSPAALFMCDLLRTYSKDIKDKR